MFLTFPFINQAFTLTENRVAFGPRGQNALSRVEPRTGAVTVVSRWLIDLAFASAPQSGLAWSCFLFPLIEPDWQFSRIRLSEKTHAFAHGRFAVRCGNWTKPYTEFRDASGPPPHTARPVSRELPVDRYTITAGASRVASGLLCVHAIAISPAGSMELVRSSVSIASGFPRVTVRSAPAIIFSGSAQRSLTLRPARSRSRHATLYTESSDSFVASAAASIATGWSEPVPGRELHPL